MIQALLHHTGINYGGKIRIYSKKRSDGQYTGKSCEDMLELCTYVRSHIHKEIKEDE